MCVCVCLFCLFVPLFQHNKKGQSKEVKYPTSHISPFNCCLCVILQLEKMGITPKILMLHFVLINSSF